LTATTTAHQQRRSPFAGRTVQELTGLRWRDGVVGPAFDEEVWDLTQLRESPTQLTPAQKIYDFTAITHAPWRVLSRELVIALLAPDRPEVALLPLARREPMNPRTCHRRLVLASQWLNWLTTHGVSSLDQVTQDHCDAYLTHRQDQGLRPAGLMATVTTLKDFGRYNDLFTTDRHSPGFMPWPGRTAAGVVGYQPGGENLTPPVPDKILRPALRAGLFIIETLGPYLTALLDQRRQQPAVANRRVNRVEFAGLMAGHLQRRQPLPELDRYFVQARLDHGWSVDDPLLRVSFGELGRELGIQQLYTDEVTKVRDLAESVVGAVGIQPRWAREAAEIQRADGAGTVSWSKPLTTIQLDDLILVVFNACLFVAAALSGMRSSELMELTTSSCLPPRPAGPGLFRYSLASKRIKGEQWGGVTDKWVVIEPAWRALELAIRLTDWKVVMARSKTDKSVNSVFGRFAFASRFDTFRRWVNSPAGSRLGLEPIPDGAVNAKMLRRTLALELAHRPHGLLAAKIHLKHISVATTEGYAARPGGAQARFHAEMAAEERKHKQQLAATAYRDYQNGILPAGPGARSLLEIFKHVDSELTKLAASQPSVVATDRHIELLLKKRADTLHIQPANYCWFTDPTKALCLKLACTPTATKPLAGLCDAARCPQATFHPQHRDVWASCVKTTETFLGNPRIPVGERSRLTAEHTRVQNMVQAIDNATTPPTKEQPR
jgi:hypothetical protein